MDIRYIKKCTEKISSSNMMNIMNNMITRSDLETIENYDKNKLYDKNDKVYIKDKNVHRIYVCKDKTNGYFDESKWKPYLIKEDNKMNMNQLYTYEEKVTVDEYGLFEYKIKLDDFKYCNTTVAVFSSITPRLRNGIDFLFTSDGIIKFLKPMNKGEKLIIEIRVLIGDVFNNHIKEAYVEETYIPVKRTRYIPIEYKGYDASSKIQLFGNGKLYEEGVDYTLDHNYIIMNDYINPGDLMSITIWNEVMITLTPNINYIKEAYVEETYIPVKRTRYIPIEYKGYDASSKIQLFGNGKLYEEGLDYTLDHNYIIMNDYINPGDLMSITIWNEVMITLTPNINYIKEAYVEETYIPVKRTRYIPIEYKGYDDTSSKIELFDGNNGKLYEEGLDYTLDHNYIIMNDYINPGDLMSITIWNEVMINASNINYIKEAYVEETYIPVKRTRYIPIEYKGYDDTSSKIELFDGNNGKLYEEGLDYTLDHNYIIMNDYINPGDLMSITIWNEVMINASNID